MPTQEQKGSIRHLGARRGEGSAPRPGHFNLQEVQYSLYVEKTSWGSGPI